MQPLKSPAALACAALLAAGCFTREESGNGPRLKPGKYYLVSQLPQNYREGSSFIEYSENGRIWIAWKMTRECWVAEEIGAIAVRGNDFTLSIDSSYGEIGTDTCDSEFPNYRTEKKTHKGRILFPTDSTMLWCVDKGGNCGAGSPSFAEYLRPAVDD